MFPTWDYFTWYSFIFCWSLEKLCQRSLWCPQILMNSITLKTSFEKKVFFWRKKKADVMKLEMFTPWESGSSKLRCHYLFTSHKPAVFCHHHSEASFIRPFCSSTLRLLRPTFWWWVVACVNQKTMAKKKDSELLMPHHEKQILKSW